MLSHEWKLCTLNAKSIRGWWWSSGDYINIQNNRLKISFPSILTHGCLSWDVPSVCVSLLSVAGRWASCLMIWRTQRKCPAGGAAARGSTQSLRPRRRSWRWRNSSRPRRLRRDGLVTRDRPRLEDTNSTATQNWFHSQMHDYIK